VTLVSVCIPTRNQSRFLRAAIDSALAQDVGDLEVLVHDDASQDGTADVLARCTDPRLRVLRHARPLGVAANRNSLLDHARGRYIAWLDSDDVYLPHSLARRLRILESVPSVGLVHGGFEVIDASDRTLRRWPQAHPGDAVEPGQVAFRDLIASNAVTTSTVMVRRSAQAAAGPFCTAIGASSTDWDMWLRIALHADVGYTAAPVAGYRQHEQTISRATSVSGERLRCDVRVARHVLGTERRRIDDVPAAARTARAALAAKALAHAGDASTLRNRREALRAVAFAARLAPRTVGPQALQLLYATARGDDYACYRRSRSLRAALAEQLGPTRYGDRLRAGAEAQPRYEESLAGIAQRVRRMTPADAQVATVTKWDPTLLWLSRRRGVQFPDRRQMPNGYPQDAAAVIDHFELLRSRGVTHLVFTSATTWWLDHYVAFREHLDATCRTVHRDDDCVIYGVRS
jgi:hypothetical protein